MIMKGYSIEQVILIFQPKPGRAGAIAGPTALHPSDDLRFIQKQQQKIGSVESCGSNITVI